MKTLIISTGFADLEVRDGELVNQMVFCHADTANDLGSEVTFSDAATQAILPVADLVEVSGEPGSFHVVRPATPTPIGIELDDPANEALPTDPDDPRIVDADGDGKPGVTATVKVSEDLQGEIYLARREIFAYDVTQVSEDRFEGTITDDSEQLIIGASDPLFQSSSGSVGPARRARAEPGDLGARRRRLGLRPPRRGARHPVPAQPRGRLVICFVDAVVSDRYHPSMAMTLRLDDDEHEALRSHAAAEGISMQDAARRAIREYVARSEHRARVGTAADRILEVHAEAIERLGR
ncbi:MAG: ribbon-helix-helix protein, CopG family [Acidimicrobiales bacterium]